METEKIQIENLKCGGCANTIRTNLKKIDQVTDVSIDLENSEVTISSHRQLKRESIIEMLGKLGYPEVGQGNTMQKVKSYVSCAMGRMSN